MQRIFLDFETMWSDDYTLKKMTPVEYIQDPRFEALGCAFITEGGPTEWVDGSDLPRYFASRDWSNTFAISHNSLFDMLILAFRYGVRPGFYGDTLSMARNWLSHSLSSLSLASLASYYGLPDKMETVNKLKGVNFHMLLKMPELYEETKRYAIDDAEKCRTIFGRMLMEGFPPPELKVVNWVVHMAANPSFVVDLDVLSQHHATILAKKQMLLDAAYLEDPSGIMSDPQLAVKLSFLGVDPVPQKTSKRTGQLAWAFAKSDKEFTALLDHPEPMVQALVAARLGHKSTLEETRTQRLIDIGRCAPALPVPLKYSGAHTHRLCLAGHMNITILRDCVVQSARLDALQPADLIWDGEEFVAHGGLVYAGVREVIEYDNVVGTHDHRVWTVEHGYRQLAEAKARGYDIARGGIPDPARINSARYGSDRIQNEDQVPLRSLRQGDAIELVEPARSHRDQMQGVSQTGRALPLERSRLELRPAHGISGSASLQRPEETRLQGLRGTGNRISIQLGSGDGRLGAVKPWTEASRAVYRPQQQRRPLRAKQSSLGDTPAAERQQAPTWDIVDCGPRNRFVVNGRIVHNSGDWKINLQNLPRGGELRKALRAPKGKVVVAVDASQIEARINAALSGQWDLVEAFRQGRDVYAEFAERIYGYPVDKYRQPTERFVGKTGILSLGYGSSDVVFQNMCRLQGNVQLTTSEAASIVLLYRTQYREIKNNWHYANNVVIPMIANGGHHEWGPLVTEKWAIRLPNGNKLRYRDLRHINEDGRFQWQYMRGKLPQRIYGAKTVENVVQALAFIHIAETEMRLEELTDGELMAAHQVHDELIFVVDEKIAELVLEVAIREMSKPPAWMPAAPLAAEGSIGYSYGEAK